MYDNPLSQSDVTTAIQQSSSGTINDDTLQQILTLSTTSPDSGVTASVVLPDVFTGNVNLDVSTKVAFLQVTSPSTPVTVQSDTPVVLLSGNNGADVIFQSLSNNDTVAANAGTVQRLVTGTGGADKIVIADNHNTQVFAGSGDTVHAGSGFDTVIAGNGNSTVVGGTHGQTVVQLSGVNSSDLSVTVDNGHVVVGGGGSITVMDHINVMSVNSQVVVIANTYEQGAISAIYQAALGHSADATNLAAVFAQYNSGALSLEGVINNLVNSDEFKASADNLDNTQFVQALYLNAFNRAAETDGLNFWVSNLDAGNATRAQVLHDFALIAAHSYDHSIEHTEVNVVGSVHIIGDIV